MSNLCCREEEEVKTAPKETTTILEQELVQTLSKMTDPLAIVTRVTRLLEGVVTRDTATALLKRARKSARFHLVLDAAAASGKMAVHSAILNVLPPSKTNLPLLGQYFT